MDSQSYAVNYTINVVDNGSAAIKQFNEAVKTLPQNGEQFKALNTFLGGLNKQVPTAKTIEKLTGLGAALQGLQGCANVTVGITLDKNALTQLDTGLKQLQSKINGARQSFRLNVNVNIESAEKALDRLEARLNKLTSKGYVIPIGAQIGGSAASRGGGRAAGARAPRAVVTRTAAPTMRQTLGPTYYNSGTNFAGEMVKGMGMMYGLQGIISGLSKSIKDAIEYQNITQTTKNILKSNYTGRSFDSDFGSMESTIRNIGVRTRFTAPEVAAAGKFLAMAGQDVNEIRDSMGSIANLALVGDTDLGQTADVTTNIMSGFNIKAQQMDRVADVLVKTFTMSNTTLMELAESFKYVGSISRQAGLKFEDVAAAMGVLGNAGVKGSSAGTALRNIIFNVASPTKKQKEAWDAVGIKTKDENGNARSMVDLFADLGEYTKNMTGESKIKLFSALFFKRASTSAASLGINAANIDKIFQATSGRGSMGVAHDLAWAKNNMTVEGLWHQTASAFTEAGMRAFTSIQGPLMAFLRELTEKFKTPEFTEQMKSGMQLMLDLVKTIVDAIGTIGRMWMNTPSWLKTLFKTFVTIQMWMSIVFSPLKAILSTVGTFANTLRGVGAKVTGAFGYAAGGTAVRTNAAGLPVAVRERNNNFISKWGRKQYHAALRDRWAWVSRQTNRRLGHYGVRDIWGVPMMDNRTNSNLFRSATNAYMRMPPAQFNEWAQNRAATRQAAFQRLQRMTSNRIWNSGGRMAQVSRAMRLASVANMAGRAMTGLGGAIKGVLGLLGITPWMLVIGAIGAFAYGIYQAHQAAERASEAFTKMTAAATSMTEANIDWSDSNALILNQMGVMSSSLLDETERVQAATRVWSQFWTERSGANAPDPKIKFGEGFLPYQDVLDATTGFAGIWNVQKNKDKARELRDRLGLRPNGGGGGIAGFNKRIDDDDALQALMVYEYARSGDNAHVKAYKRSLIEDINSQNLIKVADNKKSMFTGYKGALLHGTSDTYGSDLTMEGVTNTRAFALGTNASIQNLYNSVTKTYSGMAQSWNKYGGQNFDTNNRAASDFIASIMGLAGWKDERGKYRSVMGKNWNQGDWRATIRQAAGTYMKSDGTQGRYSQATTDRNIVQMYNEFMREYGAITDKATRAVLEPFTKKENWEQFAYGSKLNWGSNDLSGGGGHGTATWNAPNQEQARMKGYGSTPKQIIVNIDNLMKIDKIDATDERKLEAIANLKQELAQALIDVVADVDDEYGRGSSIGS